MALLPKTIQIFLPEGSPHGVKIAEFTNRNVQVVVIPRANLEFACSRPELARTGIYFLLSEPTSAGLPRLYVGEAEPCAPRLKTHNKEKEWWTTALVCVVKTADFTKAHVKYLEWFSHQEAISAGRSLVDNSNVPTKSFVSESVEADLREHFDTLRVLLSTLGYPIFDRIVQLAKRDLLLCKGKKAFARGEYTENGLTVFENSTANRQFSGSSDAYLTTVQQELIAAGTLVSTADPDVLKFSRNHIFPSPTQASAIVLARNSNGWIEWKYEDGRTLDAVKRGAL
ncbi:MAG: hypothetical protein JWM32_3109 [Verrucomicrobia bacterium]|nr:hypothetical protein [Verrucomicrobiota bacterium]